MARPSKSSSKPTKTTSIFDEYKDSDDIEYRIEQLDFISSKGLNQTQVNTLKSMIYEWAMKDDSIDFEDFLHRRFIERNTFERWEKQFPDLKRARQFADKQIGILREEGMSLHAFDYSTYSRTLHLYRDDWKIVRDEDHERKVIITQKAAQAPAQINLVVKEVKSFDDVAQCPTFKEKDEAPETDRS